MLNRSPSYKGTTTAAKMVVPNLTCLYVSVQFLLNCVGDHLHYVRDCFSARIELILVLGESWWLHHQKRYASHDIPWVECFQNMWLETKRNDPPTFQRSIVWTCILTSKLSAFTIVALLIICKGAFVLNHNSFYWTENEWIWSILI